MPGKSGDRTIDTVPWTTATATALALTAGTTRADGTLVICTAVSQTVIDSPVPVVEADTGSKVEIITAGPGEAQTIVAREGRRSGRNDVASKEVLIRRAADLRDVIDVTRPKAGIRTIELFSDGYPTLPDAATAAAWEDSFARAEAEDRHMIGAHATVKGATRTEFHDDRTVVIVTG